MSLGFRIRVVRINFHHVVRLYTVTFRVPMFANVNAATAQFAALIKIYDAAQANCNGSLALASATRRKSGALSQPVQPVYTWLLIQDHT